MISIKKGHDILEGDISVLRNCLLQLIADLFRSLDPDITLQQNDHQFFEKLIGNPVEAKRHLTEFFAHGVAGFIKAAEVAVAIFLFGELFL